MLYKLLSLTIALKYAICAQKFYLSRHEHDVTLLDKLIFVIFFT